MEALLLSLLGAAICGAALGCLAISRRLSGPRIGTDLARLVVLGLLSMFLLRAVIAPIGFLALAPEAPPSATVVVASIGLVGTVLLAVGFPIAVAVRGARSGVPASQWSPFVIAAVASHAVVALLVVASYAA
jgi:hypothetical protein